MIQTSEPLPLPLALMRQIGKYCDRFEAEWRAGQRPLIEDYLQFVDVEQQPALFRSLLQVELELSRESGREATYDDVAQRFPRYLDIISELINNLEGAASPPKNKTRISHRKRLQSSEPEEQTLDRPAESHPTKLGRFEIIEVLGEGGFGIVYRARDPQLEREVALKVPHDGVLKTTQDVERFLREARATATLRHPNICPVYEIGENHGRHFIVMAYIAGAPLSAAIKSNDVIGDRQAAQVIQTLTRALHVAHQKGIVHRDLKPENIMLDSESQELVIMDFGLACRSNTDESRLTQTGQIMGTPAYMPPEQARGQIDSIGPASDTYSLGIILYELLTGTRPFNGPVADVLVHILHTQPEFPSRIRPGINSQLEAICMKAISKRIDDRFQTMEDFDRVLTDFLDATDPRPVESLSINENVDILSADRRSVDRLSASSLGVEFDYLEEQKQQIEQLRRRGEQSEVIKRLEEIVALPDPCAAYYVEWAKMELSKLQVDSERLRRECQAALRAAVGMVKDHDYEQAALLLQRVPEEFRDDEFNKLWTATIGLMEEVRSLSSDVSVAMRTNSSSGMVEKVERLLEIKPEHAAARQLYRKLGNQQQTATKSGAKFPGHKKRGALRWIILTIIAAGCAAAFYFNADLLP